MAARSRDFATVLEVMKAFEFCRNPVDLKTQMLRALSHYGFQHACVMVAQESGNSKSSADRSLLSSWPKAWFEYYHGQKLFQHDPIAARARHSSQTFRWSDVVATTADARHVMAAACDHRMKSGICIPVHTFEGFYAGITIAGEEVDETPSGKFFAELVGIYAFNRLSKLHKGMGANRTLTDRQREILSWVAAGKTAWDISVILKISLNTVNTTIAHAMARLNVTTRAQAIAEGIRRGELTL